MSYARAAMCLGALLIVPGGAMAQAPINSNVALQPRTGGWIVRQLFRFSRADFNTPAASLDINLATSATTVVYGVTNRVTLLLTAPAALSRRIKNNATGARRTDSGLVDTTALSKVRLYRNDFGPTSTVRFDALLGLELPTGTNGFSGDSVDPIVGGVFTYAHDRLAIDADLLWKFDTAGGPAADLFRYDSAIIYRLRPAHYDSPNATALNALFELNGLYQTNGDNELFLSPGVQYVTTRWIAEATIQLPIWQELDHRPKADFILGFSVRMVF